MPAIVIHKCDVSNEEDVKAGVQKCVDSFGTVHIALASAGVAWPNLTLNRDGDPLDSDMFESVININLLGSVYLAKHAAIQMAKN